MFEHGILNVGDLITESTSENAPNSSIPEDVSNHIEDPNVTIPGGLKEQPTKDAITMTTKEYEDAMKALQNSFKESAEVVQLLQQARIVDEDQGRVQMEAAMDEALFDVYDNGPMYEAVSRSDKKSVKKIVGTLRPKIESFCKDNDINYRKPAIVLRVLLNGPIAFWGERLWQIAGVINIESGNVQDVQKSMNEKFAEDLDGYKVLFSKTPPNIVDLLVNKFGWKNKRKTYFVLIDKKLPEELKQFEDAVEEGIKSKNTGAIKEGTDMNELYRQYLMGYAESGITDAPYSLQEFEEKVTEIAGDNQPSILKEAYQDYLVQFAECGFDEAPCSFTEFSEAVASAAEGIGDDDAEITEATRLAKEIHKKRQAGIRNEERIKELEDLKKSYEPGSTEYKLIESKIKKLATPKIIMDSHGEKHKVDTTTDSIYGAGKHSKDNGRRAKDNQRNEYDTRPVKPRKSLQELKKQLDAIGESFDASDFLTAYINGIL